MRQPVYRPIFAKAIKILWQKKGLWLLGIFAGVLNTGAVLEVGFRIFTPVDGTESLSRIFVTNLIPGYDAIRLTLIQFTLIEPVRAVFTGLLLATFIVAIVYISVIAQAGIIEGTLTRKKLKTNELLEQSQQFFGRIFLIDIFAKIAIAALLAGSVIPLSLIGTGLWENIIASYVVLILYAVLALVVSLLSILAAVSVVHGRHDLVESIEKAWLILRRHPIVILEIAIILFFAQILVLIGVALILLLLWVPYLIGFIAAVLTTTTVLTAIASLIYAAIAFAVIALASGILTAFQYIVWSLVYQKLHGRGLKSKWHRFKKTYRLF